MSTPDPSPNASIVEPIYLPIQPGVAGERSKRPSQKSVEAKDSVRILAPSMMVSSRVCAPQAMLIGGGSCDFSMRGSAALHYKPIVWSVVGAAIPPTASFTRAGTYNWGPTRGWSEYSGNQGIMPAALGGIPIPIETFGQSLGGFVYEFNHAMLMSATAPDLATLAGNTVQYIVGAHAGTASSPPNYISFISAAGGPTFSASGGMLQTAIDLSVVGGALIKFRCRIRVMPVATALISSPNYPFNSLQLFYELEMKWGLATGGPMFSFTQASPLIGNSMLINVAPKQQYLYLDAGFYSNETAALTNVATYFNLFMSSGTTLSASDGYPYNMKLADVSDVTFGV